MSLFVLIVGFLAACTAAGADPGVLSVENGGLLFTDNQAGVSGVDAGYSLPIGPRTLWLFGDVFLLHPTNPERRYVGGVTNTGLLVPRGGVKALRRYTFLTDRTTGLARPVIPYLAGEGPEVRLWPFGGWYDTRQRRIYLYWARIRTTGEGGPFGFVVEGYGLAAADAASPEDLSFRRLPNADGSEIWWPYRPPSKEGARPSPPVFGSAVVGGVPENEPYLYIVGLGEAAGRKPGKLARVRRDQIENLAAYEYFSGTPARPSWSRRVEDSADIEGLSDFPSELSVSYNRWLKGYLAVHSVAISERIRLSLAPNPWGPYRTIAEIGAPHQAFENAFCYAGKEHPELAEDRGRIIYVTYVDNRRYWLQLLKVTFGDGP